MRRADLAVYGADGTLVLVVEVWTKMAASAQWIAELRQNLYESEAIFLAPYFLLVLPDCLYLWIEGSTPGAAGPPAYSVPTASILTPYLGNPPLVLDEISRTGLEMLITSWLNDLTSVLTTPDHVALAHPWLVRSGLYEAIKRGKVVVEALV